MFDILWICLTYCIGSVPFGLVFAKTFCRIDPRTAGSGNVGATNVARLCGKAWGAATLACDLLKGTIPVFIAMQYSTSELVWTLTALAAILGHLYSCFLGFIHRRTIRKLMRPKKLMVYDTNLLDGILKMKMVNRTGIR